MTLFRISAEIAFNVLIALILTFIFVNAFSLNKTLKYIFYYCLLAFVIEVLARVLINYGVKNIFVLNILVIFQFVIFSLFFKNNLVSSKDKKVVNVIGVLVLSGVFLQYLYNADSFLTYNPIAYFLTMLPLITYSLIIMFRSILQGKINDNILIIFGLMLYMSTSLIVFSSSDLLNGLKPHQFNYIYILNNITYILFLILIFINLWKLINSKQTS